jgi:hypothetical protein
MRASASSFLAAVGAHQEKFDCIYILRCNHHSHGCMMLTETTSETQNNASDKAIKNEDLV